MFKWSIGAGLLVVPAFAIGLNWGVVGVAVSYFVASALLFYPGLAIPFGLVGIKIYRVLLAMLPALCVSFVMAIVIKLVLVIYPISGSNQLVKLIAVILIGIFTYCGLNLIVQWTLLKDIYRVIFSFRK